MDKCRYCNWEHPTHAETCTVDNRGKQIAWMNGWNEGRAGELHPSEDDPVFVLGFLQGQVDLDEAEGGWDIRWNS